MHKLYGTAFLLALFFSTSFLGAQQCFYTLQMFDSFGDGWNGGELTITIDGDTSIYFLDNINDDGSFATVDFQVAEGQNMVLGYQAGAFANEVSFIILSDECMVVYESEQGPEQGDTIFEAMLECTDCPIPVTCSGNGFEFSRLRSSSVDIDWLGTYDSIFQPVTFQVEYGPSGFEPNTGDGTILITSDSTARLQPLLDTSFYDVYISAICNDGNSNTGLQGPFSFSTPLTNDVGISVITDPVSDCEIGMQRVRVGITNFGGTAQSFIPFDYSVNGMPGGVAMPQDGLYTGVIGVDSTEFTSFDVQFDFSEPGDYEIQVWTALEGDQDKSNDTLTLQVRNVPNITSFPYEEGLEENNGFWTVAQNNFGAASWEWGTPNDELISGAAVGQNAWVTNLNGNYNNSEESFLLSPCFDFTDLENDAIMSFFLFVETENNFDEFFVEYTTDRENWERLGAAGTGLNWYNDAGNEWWEDDGGFGDQWALALQPLGFLAGEPFVRFRFVFSSDGSVTREGIGIDNIYIGPQPARDLVASSLTSISPVACGTPMDTLTLTFFNVGLDTATNVELNYSVDGEVVITEVYTDTLAPGEQGTYTFNATYNGTLSPIEIEAWINWEDDEQLDNDTVRIVVSNITDLPLLEDFESGEPENWRIDANSQIDIAHNSGTNVIFSNLFALNPNMRFVTANYGRVSPQDSILFDYRFVDFGAGTDSTILGIGDSLVVRVIPNCDTIETTLLTINANNHDPSSQFTRIGVEIPEEYLGLGIQVVFEAFWSEGDYFLDIDNINIKKCASTFEAGVLVVDATTNGSTDGSIEVRPQEGLAPYTYLWNTGEMSNALDSIPAGAYMVTVTDAQGCKETLDIIVEFLTGTEEFAQDLGRISAYPNPTRGILNLSVELVESRELQLEMINQVGQVIFKRDYGQQIDLREQVDIADYPAGIYFLKVFAGDQYRTLRILKTR